MKGREMKEIIGKFVSRALGLGLLIIIASTALPGTAAGQMQQWLQQERMRQAYDRQQWLQWQQLEQMRQMYDRQQWLQWQQQERLRQMYQR